LVTAASARAQTIGCIASFVPRGIASPKAAFTVYPDVHAEVGEAAVERVGVSTWTSGAPGRALRCD